MGTFKRQLTDSGAAFRAVFANPNLRRLQFAWAGSAIGQWAYAIAVSVYAYHVSGAKAVGIVWLVRMLPAAVVSPFSSLLADRLRRARVMLGCDLARVGLVVPAAVNIWLGGSAWVVYGLAAASMVVGTAFKPAESALVPILARTPSELTAANVVGSTIESLGFFVGPALAGILLGLTSPATVFIVTGGMLLWSAFFVFRIDAEEPAAEPEARASGIVQQVGVGFKVLAGDSRLRILVGLLAAQNLVAGAFEVLIVVTAIKLLGLGNSGVGYLNSAFGVGALIGAMGAVMLVGIRRLSLPFVAGAVLWGAPFVLIGIYVNSSFALIMLGAVGIGCTLGDVSGLTLIQRAVPDEILGRVFGVMQMLFMVSIGVGAFVTPAIIDWLGVRGTLILAGALVPVLAVAFGPKLVAIDAAATAPDAARLALLRGIDIFAPLPGLIIEQLVSRLFALEESAGTEIIREGDPGDRFYVIERGEVDVTVEGRDVTVLGPGQYFGEIALLKDVPRTATCTAKTAVNLYALERDDFLVAVTGHASSSRTAETVIGMRIAQTTGIRTAG